MSAEQTERATPRRRQKAEEQGDRVLSREMLSACGMLASVLALGWAAESWVMRWRGAYDDFLSLGSPAVWHEGRTMEVILALRRTTVVALLPLVTVLLPGVAAVLLCGIAQNRGLRFHAEALQPKWSRYNPVTNLKNIFSLRGAARLAKTLIPVAALLWMAQKLTMEQLTYPVLSLARMPALFGEAWRLLQDTAWILFAWSAIDYLVEWRSREDRLKMSKEEIREELKQTEGNPQVRGRIRSLRRQMRRRQLKADVSRASVVITNPTHYAVALSFDFDTMEAPKVLAKGRDLLAEQIKSEARWAGVPIVENPPLARSLYRHVEPGQAIPHDLYAAVAAILAWLYRRQVEERIRQEQLREQAKKRQARAAQDAAQAATMQHAYSGGEQP
ncbi:EscU/YscU/HrcU family type III secretion system export apparatus switch protein [Paracidobacterium acidisoli]|uniref:EscU/YscU/HrcU family type III secretion system export apparatus switch protein n=1 Tax=Paracidobacterium acidisoli TaxID=2303751 RepID=A0A372IR81_9BACT|nr:EscU/YscU/HrcU family type III secretion system export apparatus switch protein [Paracidobacterium acidisoli]MBT9330302.1 EscU/YscU/HrcU family type III secretion system export apparatus switch protein [Paracidobacterium acidisoli]